MQVLVSGSHGLIGNAVVAALQRRGDVVHRLVRSAPTQTGDVQWDPQRGTIDREALAGHDAVLHFAGEPVNGRWTASKRQRIRQSRIAGTALLAGALAELAEPPSVFVSGSAIGWYGDTGDEVATESSDSHGDDFLTTVARDWESATTLAEHAGIRVVRVRTGIVQSRHGGALHAQLLPFRLGAGGRMGSGRQWVSWVHIDDLVRIVLLAVDDPTVSGPVNGVAPLPVTNAEYGRVLGRVLHRPAFMPTPAFVLRVALGGFASEILGSKRIMPERLQQNGFAWLYPELEAALRHELEQEG